MRPRFPLPVAILSLALVAACSRAEESAAPLDASAEWETIAPAPDARTEVSVATDGERVYLLGGFLAPPPDHPEGERPPAARRLLAYDASTDAWSDMGEVPVGTNHAGFVALSGRLYLVGGYRDNSFEPRSGEVWIHDPATGEWSEGSPMPTPRGALAYAVLEGRIHTIGGTVADPSGLDAAEHSPSDADASVGTHEAYDPRTDTWERLAPMPTPRNHHVAGATNGRIYVTAGREGGEARMTVTEVYDAATDSWSEAAPLPTGRSGVAGAVLDGRLYVFGGEAFGGGSRTFDDAERYDPRVDRWERLPPMPTARHGLGAASLGGAIYVVSGGPQAGFSFGSANERLVP